jgi:hypothetical protein
MSPLAGSVRTPAADYESEGRAFESLRARQRLFKDLARNFGCDAEVFLHSGYSAATATVRVHFRGPRGEPRRANPNLPAGSVASAIKPNRLLRERHKMLKVRINDESRGRWRKAGGACCFKAGERRISLSRSRFPFRLSFKYYVCWRAPSSGLASSG